MATLQHRLLWAGCIVSAALARFATSQDTPRRAPGCHSEQELLDNLRWLREEMCAAETFSEPDALVPSTVATQACAGAVRSVAHECEALFSRSPGWFATRQNALTAAVAASDALPDVPASADPCATHPCLNGGVCVETSSGESLECTAESVADRTEAVNTECCNEPEEDCSSGQPATCNAGCAAVLLPYIEDCRSMMQPSLAATVQRATESCPRSRCDCPDGWGGETCEVPILLLLLYVC